MVRVSVATLQRAAAAAAIKPVHIGLSRHVLQFSYVGTEYSGVAPNQTSKLPSVHSEMMRALERLSLSFPPVVALSSRTDAGVHAVSNTAHVDLWRRPRDEAKWLAGEKSAGAYGETELYQMLNHYLPPSIAVHAVLNVPQTFHARFDATHREYVYKITCPLQGQDGGTGAARSSSSSSMGTPKISGDPGATRHQPPQHRHQQQQQKKRVKQSGVGRKRRRRSNNNHAKTPTNPFEHARCWQVRDALDLTAMQGAAAVLEGTHDFSSFRGAGCQAASPIKTVASVQVSRLPPPRSAVAFPTPMPPSTAALSSAASPLIMHEVEVRIKANSFLYNQVRNIVAALVEVGAGAESIEWLKGLLIVRDRSCVPRPAPAAGLYLREVGYQNLANVRDKHVGAMVQATDAIIAGVKWADNLDIALLGSADGAGAGAGAGAGGSEECADGGSANDDDNAGGRNGGDDASNHSAKHAQPNTADAHPGRTALRVEGVDVNGLHYTFRSQGARWRCTLRQKGGRENVASTAAAAAAANDEDNDPGGGAGDAGIGGEGGYDDANDWSGMQQQPSTFEIRGEVPAANAAAAASTVVPMPVLRQLLAIAWCQRETRQPLFFPHCLIRDSAQTLK